MLAAEDRARLQEATHDDILTEIPAATLLRAPPARQWMVEDCFPVASVGMVSGDGGIGKSLLMQQLVTSAALGLPWLGLPLRRGAGILFACEDDEGELHRRQHKILQSLGREVEDAINGGLRLISRVGRDNTLSYLDRKSWRMQPTDLFSALLHRALSVGASYVVIDTATQVFAGNQNDEQQVMQFINQLRRFAVSIQGIVVITKHPSMSGRSLGTGESGNVAWSNSVRSRLYVYERKDGTTELRGMKANYSRKLDKIALKWQRGAFVVEEAALPRDYSEPSY